MAGSETRLTRSMEDYLEAIYNLKVRSQVARVKDIAAEMGVKMPSVTGAIRALASRGLVKHQPYESVELTNKGLNAARNIAHRHSAVKEFLVGVLGLCEEEAEIEACGIEHAIDPATLDKLLKFVDFVHACADDKTLHLDHFQHFLKTGEYPEGCNHQEWLARRAQDRACHLPPIITSTKLSELCPGMKGRIAFVSGQGPIRKRLMEMGLTSDAEFEIIRTAPLGDPMEIKIRGYFLSLRKSEAEHIEVEVK